jgi:hypothetical protein
MQLTFYNYVNYLKYTNLNYYDVAYEYINVTGDCCKHAGKLGPERRAIDRAKELGRTR